MDKYQSGWYKQFAAKWEAAREPFLEILRTCYPTESHRMLSPNHSIWVREQKGESA